MVRGFKLEEGKIYTNRGGGQYKCLSSQYDGALVQNINSGWTCQAHIITMYDDCTIEWDYSTGGCFR